MKTDPDGKLVTEIILGAAITECIGEALIITGAVIVSGIDTHLLNKFTNSKLESIQENYSKKDKSKDNSVEKESGSSSSDSRDQEKEREHKNPRSGSRKEKANDIPSWAEGEIPYTDENGKGFAKRLFNEHYVKGNWKEGFGSEYNKLRKYGDRAFEQK